MNKTITNPEQEKNRKIKKISRLKNKILLANPYRKLCSVLEENEMSQLQEILKRLIEESGKSPRQFATDARIQIGLESSLRTIKQGRAACVLLSLSIKPHCLISLIARNSEFKDAKVPVYAQPKLENYCEEIFGIRSLALVLPKVLKCSDKDLEEWIQTKQKIIEKVEEKEVEPVEAIKKFGKRKKSQINSTNKIFKFDEEIEVGGNNKDDDEEEEEEPEEDEELTNSFSSNARTDSSWSGDYISFSSGSTSLANDSTLVDEKEILHNVLDKIQHKAKKQIQNSKMEDSPQSQSGENESVVDYEPLVLLTLKPNPNRKHKQKRNNNNME